MHFRLSSTCRWIPLTTHFDCQGCGAWSLTISTHSGLIQNLPHLWCVLSIPLPTNVCPCIWSKTPHAASQKEGPRSKDNSLSKLLYFPLSYFLRLPDVFWSAARWQPSFMCIDTPFSVFRNTSIVHLVADSSGQIGIPYRYWVAWAG